MPATRWVTLTRGGGLTGRVRFTYLTEERRGLFRRRTEIRLVMNVEVQEETAIVHPASEPPKDSGEWSPSFYWREANPIDLSHPALRWLIDGAQVEPRT